MFTCKMDNRAAALLDIQLPGTVTPVTHTATGTSRDLQRKTRPQSGAPLLSAPGHPGRALPPPRHSLQSRHVMW